jgi:cardiolipin synthase
VSRLPERARTLMERALMRAAGAPLVPGNAVRLLQDARENYPAWLSAIESAERAIYFETYILNDDDVGLQFGAALADRARHGVKVRLVYDWLGAVGKTSRRFWRDLTGAGIEVRCFNPPRFVSPFGWLQRDHRKSLSVDGRVGFVSGLCVGREWSGDAARGIEPWRDIGVEIRGPAVTDVDAAFAQVWAATGPPLPKGERLSRRAMRPEGDVALRVVATTPGTSGLFRLDQLVAAAAERTLWLADAYFAATPPYVQALRAAARDGVDVRLLVPGSSDIPLLRPVTQAGYRPLLEAGVRVFEWKGPMMHAKTAVADGRWARVGSSNLNVASWLGNYELDAVIEDAPFAEAMERAYETDLDNATEIVLRGRQPRRKRQRQPRRPARGGRRTGSASRLAASALRAGNTVGAAVADRRILTINDRRTLSLAGVAVLVLAAVALVWPRFLAIPMAFVLGWVGLALVARGLTLGSARDRSRPSLPVPARAPSDTADPSP